MAPVSFQLVMRSGPTPGKVFSLNKSEIYVGRDINNDIVISDAEISRKHARMILQGGGYVLEDLGSTNGSFVNGQRLMGPYSLHPGELIMFGENVGLSYDAAPFDPNATMVAGAGQTSVPAFANEPLEVAPPPPPKVQSYAPPPPPPLEEFPRPSTPPPMMLDPVAPPEPAPAKKRGCQVWALAGCGCLVVLLCPVVVGFLIYQFAPADLMCNPPLRGLTDFLLQITGLPYYCP